MAVPGRLELPTFGLGNRCSIRLSYGTTCAQIYRAPSPEHNSASLLNRCIILALGLLFGRERLLTLLPDRHQRSHRASAAVEPAQLDRDRIGAMLLGGPARGVHCHPDHAAEQHIA